MEEFVSMHKHRKLMLWIIMSLIIVTLILWVMMEIMVIMHVTRVQLAASAALWMAIICYFYYCFRNKSIKKQMTIIVCFIILLITMMGMKINTGTSPIIPVNVLKTNKNLKQHYVNYLHEINSIYIMYLRFITNRQKWN